jgi:hypothetical protein
MIVGMRVERGMVCMYVCMYVQDGDGYELLLSFLGDLAVLTSHCRLSLGARSRGRSVVGSCPTPRFPVEIRDPVQFAM